MPPPWGRVARVAVDEADASSLHPDERTYAASLGPARRGEWLAGRVALRSLLGDAAVSPILVTPRGAPALPPGVVGSVSHKDGVVVAVVDEATGWTLGVDLEVDTPPRIDVAVRVLTAPERAALDGLAPEARGRHVRRVFAAKEAVYKAIDPWLGRYVGFAEVELVGDLARPTVRARAEDVAGLHVEVRLTWSGGEILAWARARPR